ncbi:MFS transporter [Clostridium sp. UBA4548]|uniref:MFS transporter n=1 Tax=Clostridium sp. UBA4548 TaxID=1946361 RepID=UPI0025C0108B|nr:MFS transporter [Clostridium sp. UBA4548]
MKKIKPYNLYLIITLISQILFSLIFTVNILYHINTAKLNPLQLVLVGTVLEITIFLFEIPTGIVADIKSRKLSIIIGYTLMGTGFIIEGFFPFFFSIIISQLFFGIGYTFISGATQAWIIDELGEENSGNIFVKGSQLGQLGELIAIPISIIVGLISLSLPIVLGGVGMILLAIFLTIVMTEDGYTPRPHKNQSHWTQILDTLKTTKQYIKLNHLLILLLALGLAYGLYSEGFDRLWTAHLIKNFNWDLMKTLNSVTSFGIIRGISILLSIVALEILNRRLHFNKLALLIKVLLISSLIIMLSLIGFSLTKNLYIALILFWIISIARSITSPLLDTMLSNIITDNNIRATIFSVRGQVDSIGQILGGPIVGSFGVIYSIRTALLISAILLSPVLLIYKLIIYNLKKIISIKIKE